MDRRSEISVDVTQREIPSLAALPSGLKADYEAVVTLGHGAMGVVVKAVHRRLERSVAIKLPILFSPEHQQRFVREGRILSRFEHPNMVRVYDAGESDGKPYIVLEFVEGFTLHDVAHARPLEVGEAVELTMQLLEALGHAHAADVLHRDVKAENALITPEGTLKLADFGLAWSEAEQSQTRTGVIMGTPGYMAPEQVDGQKIDRRADLYSAAIVLYELLAGRLPFEAPDVPSLMRLQLTTPPPGLRERRPDVPRTLETVVAKALAKSPDARYPAAVDLSKALAQAVGEHALDAGRARLLDTLTHMRHRSIGGGVDAAPGRHQTLAVGGDQGQALRTHLSRPAPALKTSALARAGDAPAPPPAGPAPHLRTHLTGKTPALQPTQPLPPRPVAGPRPAWVGQIALLSVLVVAAGALGYVAGLRRNPGAPGPWGTTAMPANASPPASGAPGPIAAAAPLSGASVSVKPGDVACRYVALDRLAVEFSTVAAQSWWIKTQLEASRQESLPTTQHRFEIPVPSDGVVGQIALGLAGASEPVVTRLGPQPARLLEKQLLDGLATGELSHDTTRKLFMRLLVKARGTGLVIDGKNATHGPLDFAKIVARHPEVGRPVGDWLDALMAHPELGKVYFELRDAIGQILLSRETSVEDRWRLIAGLDGLQAADALATYIGRPPPFRAGTAREPAIEYRFIPLDRRDQASCSGPDLEFEPKVGSYCNVQSPDEDVHQSDVGENMADFIKESGKDYGAAWATAEATFVEMTSDGKSPLTVCLRVSGFSPQRALVLLPPGSNTGIPLRISEGHGDDDGWCHVTLRGAMVPSSGTWKIHSAISWTDYMRPSFGLDEIRAGPGEN